MSRISLAVSRRGYRFIAAAVSAPSQWAGADETAAEGGPRESAQAVLTVLCRSDAALAGLIRAVAAALEREPLSSTFAGAECLS